MKGRGMLTSCLGCARNVMQWTEIWNNLLRLGGGSSMTGNGQEQLPAHLVPPSWPQTAELFFTSACSAENYFCHKRYDLSVVLASFHLSWF